MIDYLDHLIKNTTLEKISYLIKTFGRKDLELFYQKLKDVTSLHDEIFNRNREQIESEVIELFKKVKSEAF